MPKPRLPFLVFEKIINLVSIKIVCISFYFLDFINVRKTIIFLDHSLGQNLIVELLHPQFKKQPMCIILCALYIMYCCIFSLVLPKNRTHEVKQFAKEIVQFELHIDTWIHTVLEMKYLFPYLPIQRLSFSFIQFQIHREMTNGFSFYT